MVCWSASSWIEVRFTSSPRPRLAQAHMPPPHQWTSPSIIRRVPGPMPGNGELVARQFIALLQRADKGDIRIQSHGVNTAPVSDEPVHANAEEAEEARQDYAAELHRASFLALHSARRHRASGEPSSSSNTEDPHHFLYAALKTRVQSAGLSRAGSVWAPTTSPPQAFEILLALGVMTIDGDQVAHKASTAHELATNKLSS